MSSDAYRSYVVRVRRRVAPSSDDVTPAGEVTTRLDVEDLLGGSTATMSGPSADTFADSLQRLVELAPPPDPAPEA